MSNQLLRCSVLVGALVSAVVPGVGEERHLTSVANVAHGFEQVGDNFVVAYLTLSQAERDALLMRLADDRSMRTLPAELAQNE